MSPLVAVFKLSLRLLLKSRRTVIIGAFCCFPILASVIVSMVVLSALVRLPIKVIFAFGAIMVAGHNLLDGFSAQGSSPLAVTWYLLHQFAFVAFGGHTLAFVYPMIPWVGVLALGYVFGAMYRDGSDVEDRTRAAVRPTL